MSLSLSLSCHLDYCNLLLYGLPKTLNKHLLKTAARLTPATYKYDHIMPVLQELRSQVTSRTSKCIQNPAIYIQMLSWLCTNLHSGLAYIETVNGSQIK